MNIAPITPNPPSRKPTPMCHTFIDENLVKLDGPKEDCYCPACCLDDTPNPEAEILTPEEQETFMHLLAKAMHGMIASVRHDENGPIAQYLSAATNPFTTSEMVDKTPEQIEQKYLDEIIGQNTKPLTNYDKLFEELGKYIKETPEPASYISDEPPLMYRTPDTPILDFCFDDIKTPESEDAPPVSPMYDDTPEDFK